MRRIFAFPVQNSIPPGVFVLAATVGAMAWAIPGVLGVFAAVSLPTAVGVAYILRKKSQHEPSLSIFNAEAALPPAEPPFTDAEKFIAKFELRYLPNCGSFADTELRTWLYVIFWPEVQDGLDIFALCDRVRRSRAFSTAEREEIVSDLLSLVFLVD
jgi:hypothetical protein